jgi:hypothetical protein
MMERGQEQGTLATQRALAASWEVVGGLKRAADRHRREIKRAHGLIRASRKALRRVGSGNPLEHPAILRNAAFVAQA